MRHIIKWVLIIMGGFILTIPGKAQNILTCEIKKNQRRNAVLEVKDNNQNVVAKIFRENRTDIIECKDRRYAIKNSWNRSYVFYNSVNEDTLGVLTRKRIQLKKEPEYIIRTGRSGMKVKEENEIILTGTYNPDLRYYHIEIQTPIYHENLINLLAVYYATKKCREISQSNQNQVWMLAN